MHTMDKSICDELELPGFRFHPTEEELLNFYLKSIVFGKKLCGGVIGFLNIYNYDPWELPGLAKIGEREWYFFVPRDRKHGSGNRPNRTTEHGFWKATGSDRKIFSISDPKKLLGLRKTLVFYEGRAPRGMKTDWIMNEYRLPEKCSSSSKDIVLCKIYRKATSLKMLEHKAAMEEEIKTVGSYSSSSPLTPTMDSISYCNQFDQEVNDFSNNMGFEKENEATILVEEKKCEEVDESSKAIRPRSTLMLPDGKLNFAELQVPSMDWTQDSFWTLFSPCLDYYTTFLPMC